MATVREVPYWQMRTPEKWLSNHHAFLENIEHRKNNKRNVFYLIMKCPCSLLSFDIHNSSVAYFKFLVILAGNFNFLDCLKLHNNATLGADLGLYG